MDKIAVLIPCYNEGQTIAKVVKDYREALPEATIYVYDNNSSDHTDEIAREAGAPPPPAATSEQLMATATRSAPSAFACASCHAWPLWKGSYSAMIPANFMT